MFTDTSDEIWKVIEEFPDYQVSNFGRVYSGKSDRMLNPKTSPSITTKVTLRNDKRVVDKVMSTLVADAFIEGWMTGVKVTHLDGDKSNNHVDNLSLNDWTLREPRVTEFKRYSWARRAKVVEWDQEFDTVRELADAVGADLPTVYKCLRGRQKTHLGLTYEYVD